MRRNVHNIEMYNYIYTYIHVFNCSPCTRNIYTQLWDRKFKTSHRNRSMKTTIKSRPSKADDTFVFMQVNVGALILRVSMF